MSARPVATDLEVLQRLVAPAGRDVLDVGCGDGRLARDLQGLGASVIGLETSEHQLTRAREAGEGAGLRYLVGRAEALPLADESVDVVVYMRSLHHVPIPAMADALGEARRVLRPGGIVYVAEPPAEGDFYALVRIVDDEDQVRAAARAAVDAAAAVGLERAGREAYEIGSLIGDLDALRRRMVGVDPERAPVFDEHRQALEQAFAALGEPRAGGRWFVQPMRVDLLGVAGHRGY